LWRMDGVPGRGWDGTLQEASRRVADRSAGLSKSGRSDERGLRWLTRGTEEPSVGYPRPLATRSIPILDACARSSRRSRGCWRASTPRSGVESRCLSRARRAGLRGATGSRRAADGDP